MEIWIGEPKCEKCGTTEDVGCDEDGRFLCSDCMFKMLCEEDLAGEEWD